MGVTGDGRTAMERAVAVSTQTLHTSGHMRQTPVTCLSRKSSSSTH